MDREFRKKVSFQGSEKLDAKETNIPKKFLAPDLSRDRGCFVRQKSGGGGGGSGDGQVYELVRT
jgi:hypothetical protein